MSQTANRPAGPTGRLVIGGIGLGVFALDQFTKWLVVRSFEVGDSVAVLGRVMSLTYRTNAGGAFGAFPTSALFLTVISAVVVLVLVVLGPRLVGDGRLGIASLGFVLGGAAGNLLDRVRLQHVVDFLDFHFWPVFNVADIGITVGAILLVIVTLIDARHDDHERAT